MWAKTYALKGLESKREEKEGEEVELDDTGRVEKIWPQQQTTKWFCPTDFRKHCNSSLQKLDTSEGSITGKYQSQKP